MKNKVVFVNRFFWPDESATSQILSDATFYLAARGYSVSVITSRLSYSDPSARYSATEFVDGVDVVRVPSGLGGQRSLLRRLIAFIIFYFASASAALRMLRRGDVIVVKTDPPLLSVPMAIVARVRGAHLVTWLQDVYPELAGVLGVRAGTGVIGRLLTACRDASLRAACANVVIGDRMRMLLLDRGINPDQIIIIPNWTDERAISPDAEGFEKLRASWGFSPSDVVVGYSGNLGRAHDIDTVLGAAALLQESGRSDVRFLFVGGGKQREDLHARARTANLTNIVLRPYAPRSELPQSLAIADIHWLSLRPSLEGMIVPSKVYGILASRRPAIFIGDRDGEIGQLIERYQAGFVCAVGDDAGLATQIRLLADDAALRRDMGLRGRRAVETDLSQSAALDAWQDLVDRLLSNDAMLLT